MSLIQQDHEQGFHAPIGANPRAVGPFRYCPQCHPEGVPEIPPPPPAPAPAPAPASRPPMQALAGLFDATLTARHAWAVAAGIPAPDPVPDGPDDGGSRCATCNGFRFVRRELPLNHPDFGKALPCEDCPEGRRLSQRQRALPTAIPTRYLALPLQSFPVSPRSQASYRELCEWLADLLDGRVRKPMLYLCGALSVGKTALACGCLARWQQVMGREGVFILTTELLRRIKAGYRPGAEITSDDVVEQAQRTPFLVLDDIGSESVTERNAAWLGERFFELINYRHNELLPTILTSNLRLGDLALHLSGPQAALDGMPSHGDRIAERLMEGARVLEFRGDNLRDASTRAALGLDPTQEEPRDVAS